MICEVGEPLECFIVTCAELPLPGSKNLNRIFAPPAVAALSIVTSVDDPGVPLIAVQPAVCKAVVMLSTMCCLVVGENVLFCSVPPEYWIAILVFFHHRS